MSHAVNAYAAVSERQHVLQFQNSAVTPYEVFRDAVLLCQLIIGLPRIVAQGADNLGRQLDMDVLLHWFKRKLLLLVGLRFGPSLVN